MNCKQATKILSDSQERQLSLKEKITLSMHTSMCSGCRNFSKHLGTIRSISQQFAKGSDPDTTEKKD